MAAAKKWMWVTLLATLLLGVGAGVVLDRVVLEATVFSSTADVERRGDRHRDHVRGFMTRLRDELELTPEQDERLLAVLTENHETARRFWQESRREFQALRERFRDDIRALLTDGQVERFDEMLAEHDARRSKGGRH